MSYHILHLLSHNLRVRCKLDQLHIRDSKTNSERTVPLSDVAVVVAAAKDMSVTAGALRRMAELNVLMIGRMDAAGRLGAAAGSEHEQRESAAAQCH
jgi:CRISPR/Cas system-associated endonuclease Cas1